MVKKGLKIVSILLFILFFSFSYVLASDINLNLPGTNLDSTNPDSNINDYNTTIDNNSNINNNFQDEYEENVYDPYDDTETLTPNTVNTSSQGGLSITDIINILLITVGVILILLAIAIIIRLK